jgi:hypothetical protein
LAKAWLQIELFGSISALAPGSRLAFTGRELSGRTMARCGLRMMPPVGIEIERAPL